MSVNIDLSGAVPAIPSVCTQLRVTLPGGMMVQGVPHVLGGSPLVSARAAVGALSSAMAPLGPFFAILDALLSIVKFAETVPKVVMNPGDVVKALVDVVEKAGALARLIPQLSVPLMILGVIDILIAFLRGIASEVDALATMAARADNVAALATEVASLVPIHTALVAQIAARRATISCAVGDVQPLIGTVTTLCGLIGLQGVSIDLDAEAGSLEDVAKALDAAVTTLTTFRNAIPIP